MGGLIFFKGARPEFWTHGQHPSSQAEAWSMQAGAAVGTGPAVRHGGGPGVPEARGLGRQRAGDQRGQQGDPLCQAPWCRPAWPH